MKYPMLHMGVQYRLHNLLQIIKDQKVNSYLDEDKKLAQSVIDGSYSAPQESSESANLLDTKAIQEQQQKINDLENMVSLLKDSFNHLNEENKKLKNQIKK